MREPTPRMGLAAQPPLNRDVAVLLMEKVSSDSLPSTRTVEITGCISVAQNRKGQRSVARWFRYQWQKAQHSPGTELVQFNIRRHSASARLRRPFSWRSTWDRFDSMAICSWRAFGLLGSTQEAHGSVLKNRSTLCLALPILLVLSVSGAFGAACAALSQFTGREVGTICLRGSHRIAVGNPAGVPRRKPPAHELSSFPQPRRR